MKCPVCNNDIVPTKTFRWWGWAIVIGGLLLWGIPSIIYIVYYFTKTPRECPACGYKNVYAIRK